MIQEFQKSKYTYRYLKNIYNSYNHFEIAKQFHYRENQVATKLSSKPFSWIARKLMFEWTYGYGSKPWMLLPSFVIIILFFTVCFFMMSLFHVKSGIYRINGKSEIPQRISAKSLKHFPAVLGNAFYYSLLTFTTFGYGAITPQQWVKLLRPNEVELKPMKWARPVAAFESIAGIYILALLAIVIFGK